MNKDFVHSKKFKVIISIIGSLIVALLIFQAGVFLGYNRGAFLCQWNNNYNQNFLGTTRGVPGGGFFDKDPVRPHGILGTVIKVLDSEIVIKGADGIEKIIKISDDTDMRSGRDAIVTTSLGIGDTVTVIGRPDSMGEIDADLVRVISSRNLAPVGTSTQIQSK